MSRDSGAAYRGLKKPRQLRSKQIVRAIVQACRQIMEEEGPEALNTNHIADVAGVNIASLYRWFPNKEAVINEVFEEQVASEIEDVRAIYEDFVARERSNLSDALGTLLIDPLISRQVRFLSLHACFYREHQAAFDVGLRKYGDRDETLIEEAGQWLASLMSSQYPDICPTECEHRAFVATRAAVGVCMAAARDRPEWVRQPDFRQHLLELVFSYLTPAGFRTSGGSGYLPSGTGQAPGSEV